MAHKITLIPGDGIGVEVVSAVVRILEATGVKFEWESFAAGAEAFEKYHEYIPKELVESIERTRVGGHSGRGAERVAAEDQLGVRATRRHLLDVGAHIVGSLGDADVGGVVDPVGADRHVRHLRLQRVDEGLADLADAGCFFSAPGEIYLGVRACRRRRRNRPGYLVRGQRRGDQQPCGEQR